MWKHVRSREKHLITNDTTFRIFHYSFSQTYSCNLEESEKKYIGLFISNWNLLCVSEKKNLERYLILTSMCYYSYIWRIFFFNLKRIGPFPWGFVPTLSSEADLNTHDTWKRPQGRCTSAPRATTSAKCPLAVTQAEPGRPGLGGRSPCTSTGTYCATSTAQEINAHPLCIRRTQDIQKEAAYRISLKATGCPLAIWSSLAF